MPTHYRAPGWFTRNVFNRSVAFLTRRGVSVFGSRVLAVRGRTSGAWRTTPVNLLDLEREGFLALCGERKTLERIQHTLKTGKTLRN